MGKMGRPKSDVIKDRIVTIRMSDEEYGKLKGYSRKHQQTITETIKEGVSLLYKLRNQGDEMIEPKRKALETQGGAVHVIDDTGRIRGED